jgi:C4-dicarboxylate-specific signal transduction histidine kinase
MEHLETEDSREKESTYKDDLKKSTNRICSLLAKVALDTATLAHFMHSTMDDVGKDQFKEAYQNAVKRVKARISRTEKEIVELLADENKE